MKTITKETFINKMNEIAGQKIPVTFDFPKYEVEEVSDDLIDTFLEGDFDIKEIGLNELTGELTRLINAYVSNSSNWVKVETFRAMVSRDARIYRTGFNFLLWFKK
jgi:hypothetical protein